MPKISIILPTWNVEKYIARALDSCINQTFKDIEIIVVDDCGNDKSIDIAKEYAKKDERIKIVHNEKNLGLLKARYEGVIRSSCEYITFLDPDDYLELNACEEVLQYLDGKTDLVCFNFTEFYHDKRKPKLKLYYENGYYSINEFRDFLLTRFPYMQWNIWAKVLKKEKYLNAYNVLEITEHEKINIAEDGFLYIFYLPFCNYIQTLDKSLINYFISNNSLCHGFTQSKLKEIIHNMRYLYKRIRTLRKKNKKLFLNHEAVYNCFAMAFKNEIHFYRVTHLRGKKQSGVFTNKARKYTLKYLEMKDRIRHFAFLKYLSLIKK